jgi:peptide/nickel transport system permease protein
VFRAFRRAPSGLIGVGAIVLIILTALLAPIFFQHAATTLDVFNGNQNSSREHLLGTDRLGRDILARILVASRLTITLALVATSLSAVIGVLLGATAAVVDARVRPLFLRLIDTLLAFPGIIIAIFIGAIVGPGYQGAILGVGIASSFAFARVVSTLALSIGGKEFVTAARVVGVRPARLLVRYVVPNIAETLIITLTVAVSNAIVQLSALSFLGLGVQPPEFDWGRMLTEGVLAFYQVPAAALGPATAIAISALAFGFAGEAMARAMNPLLWAADEHSSARGLRAEAAWLDDQGVRHPGVPKKAVAATVLDDRIVLTVKNLTVRFPDLGAPVTVVDDLSFSVRRGEMLGIVGESGSGKTMTAMAISQLVPYPGQVEGTIVLEGRDLTTLGPRTLDGFLGTHLAIVFQDPMSSLNPALKIGTQLTEAVQIHRHLDHKEASQLATHRLREVNMPTPTEQLARHPHELSGGMRQRVMIAMGLMNEPSLLIADEPTTALDVTIQAQIMEVLSRIQATHDTTVILISHNLALVSQTCQRVLVMYAGRVVEELDAEQLRLNPLHPYTKALVDSVPDMARERSQPLAFIPGQPPDLNALPRGCPFQPRCPLAFDKCVAERPPLMDLRSHRRVACWAVVQDAEPVA